MKIFGKPIETVSRGSICCWFLNSYEKQLKVKGVFFDVDNATKGKGLSNLEYFQEIKNALDALGETPWVITP